MVHTRRSAELPFKITIKRNPSNKTQTIPKKDISTSSQVHSSTHPPTPFIDRIYVTLKVPNKEDGVAMYSACWTAFADTNLFQQVRHSKGFLKAYRIKLGSVVDAAKWPFYECAYEDKCITRVRIDFIPVDLGQVGMSELHLALLALMDSGWAYFVENGHVSRLDVAVDFPEIEMDEFHYLPKQGATTKQWSRDGKLQTYQHGKARSSHTSIYNRKAKRISQKKPWAGKQGVRVERRLKGQNFPLKGLANLSNPFANMAMLKRYISPPPSEAKAYIWSYFMSTVEMKGMSAALAELPPQKQTAYRKHLKTNGVGWWDVEAIWHGWTPMLDELNISKASAWY